MIKLATAFSGIGAIEHALMRMGIKHELVFACDNGDIDILTKNIDNDIDDINKELNDLSLLIKEISSNNNVDDIYKTQLEGMLIATKKEFYDAENQLNLISEKNNRLLINTVKSLLDGELIKVNRKKEYAKRLDDLNKGSYANKRLKELLLLLLISNELRDNYEFINQLNLLDNIEKLLIRFDNDNGRKLIRSIIDLSQRTSMLHEKIN